MAEFDFTPKLSKSKFVTGCQCLKRLYLQIHEPELARETDEAKQAIFDQGHEVGILATRAFPDGVWVEEDHLHHQKAMERTQALMGEKSVSAIFEAAFIFDDVRVRVDILERQTTNSWRMIEVKSTSKLKDAHYQDVAIQKYVLERCGLKLSEACLMHLNRDYEYDGNAYDISQLFAVNDLSKDIEDLMVEIPAQVAEQHRILTLDAPPEVEPGDRCKSPFDCEFYELCNEEVPEHWVGKLPRIGKKLKELLDQGIELIYDIPEDFGLNDLQRRACICVQKGEPYFGKELKNELNNLKYPLYFMDFETYGPAIPRYSVMRPFDPIPFQWSVHVQRQPGGDLEHYDFLAEDANDPREDFIKRLLEVLEDSGGKGHIVVFYASFETGRLNDLAGWLPHYAPRIEKVKARIWDLYEVVKDQVYHPEFYGSFSLKIVLPALVPHMTYEGMEIAEGTQAGMAYDNMVRRKLRDDEILRLRKALLEYCGQDTLGMIELIKVLQNKVKT